MIRSVRHRPRLAAAVCVGIALATAACGASAAPSDGSHSGNGLSGTLNGAGSTAQQAAMEAWQAGFQKANPATTVNYDAIGSGGGVDQFLSGAVSFAGSDAALTNAQVQQARKQCGSDPVEVPVYISPIAVIYNLSGVSSLQLSPDTLAGIFAGTITSWDAPQIKADNPGVQLPSTAITPVHRSDESGTTANFTDYLAQASPSGWTHGSVETWPVKGGEAANGTSGVVAAVTNGAGTIGYADASQAGQLSAARVKVGGAFVGPSAEAAAATLDHSSRVAGRAKTDLAMTINRKTTAAGVYPIVLVSYQITCQKQSSASDAAMVRAFESYVVSAAGQQAAATHAGSAPLTASLRAADQQAIQTITGP